MEIVVGVIVAFIIAGIIKAINGDDGKPWPHPQPGDTHRWK
jgi:hypothetical protein